MLSDHYNTHLIFLLGCSRELWNGCSENTIPERNCLSHPLSAVLMVYMLTWLTCSLEVGFLHSSHSLSPSLLSVVLRRRTTMTRRSEICLFSSFSMTKSLLESIRWYMSATSKQENSRMQSKLAATRKRKRALELVQRSKYNELMHELSNA